MKMIREKINILIISSMIGAILGGAISGEKGATIGAILFGLIGLIGLIFERKIIKGKF